MKPALTHVALAVRDVARTIAFYSRHAQLHVVHDRTDHGVRVAWLSEVEHDPRFVLVCIEQHDAHAPAHSSMLHLGFALGSRDEVDAAATMAHAENILVSEPLYAGPVVGYFCIVADPDGNQVEFSYGQPIDPRALPPA
ncbi:MAG TPA: VOC family protein [Candidatus Binatia bacterium]|jgi:catechol 2,3-dioxygenase-like lactoylglutathione lyase family enzyme|nr:VOC family protein [Candidatus Binatia bacterium]